MSISKDIQGNTFEWMNVYPTSDYDTNPPLRSYPEIVNNSGREAYTSVNQTTRPIVFPVQSYYSFFADDRMRSSDPLYPTPDPSVLLSGHMPGEASIPPGYEGVTDADLDDDEFYYGLYRELGHGSYTKLYYLAILTRIPEFSEPTSGFLDWDQGFGSGIYHELQYYDIFGTYLGTLDNNEFSASGEFGEADFVIETGGTDMDTYYSNSFQTEALEYYKTGVRTGYIPILAYCNVGHTGPAADGHMGEFNLSHDALNNQILVENFCGPLGNNAFFVRDSPAGVWKRTADYDTTGATDGQFYDKYYPTHYGMYVQNDRTSNIINNGSAIFAASARPNRGEETDSNIKENLSSRFINYDVAARRSIEYVDKRREYITQLIGETVKVPKEFRARRQPSPKLSAARLSSIDETEQYVSNVATSTPGAATTAGTPTTYSGGSGGSSTGGY